MRVRVSHISMNEKGEKLQLRIEWCMCVCVHLLTQQARIIFHKYNHRQTSWENLLKLRARAYVYVCVSFYML